MRACVLADVVDPFIACAHTPLSSYRTTNAAKQQQDYNTATFPHMKYYDVEKFEMDEYQVRVCLCPLFFCLSACL